MIAPWQKKMVSRTGSSGSAGSEKEEERVRQSNIHAQAQAPPQEQEHAPSFRFIHHPSNSHNNIITALARYGGGGRRGLASSDHACSAHAHANAPRAQEHAPSSFLILFPSNPRNMNNNYNIALARHGGGGGRGLVWPDQAYSASLLRIHAHAHAPPQEQELAPSFCIIHHPPNPHNDNNNNYSTALAIHGGGGLDLASPENTFYALLWRNFFSRTNQFPGSSTPASPSFHISEDPPSNQTSHNYTSRAQEEHKRLHPTDKSHVPATHSQVSPSSRHCSRFNNQPTYESHRANPLASLYNPRDANRSSPLKHSTKKLNPENPGSGHTNFPPFGSSTVPSPPAQMLHHGTKESMEDSHQRSEPGACDHKPFYDFLGVNHPVGTTRGSNPEGDKRGGDDIDLNLEP